MKSKIGILGAIITFAAAGLSSHGYAQRDEAAYPSRTIKIVVGYGAGGGTDTVARLVAQKMQESFGQNVVVENRPGGNAMLGPGYVAKSKPDGYTLLFGGQGQMTVSPVIYSNMPYSLADFVPISMMSKYPLIMIVNPQHKATDVKSFIEWAKSNPEKTNYATTSPAFTLGTELFKLKTGTPGQMIPYKSGNEAVMSVLADQVTYTLVEPPAAVPQVMSGKVRALAVAAPARIPELPDVPTMKEAGVDMSVSLWAGIFAPAGTPESVVKKLEAECIRIAQLPDFKLRLRAMATDSPGNSSEEFVKAIDVEMGLWREVARQARLKFDQ